MNKLDVSQVLEGLGVLPAIVETYPVGAAWIGAMIALAIICCTWVGLARARAAARPRARVVELRLISKRRP